MTAAAIPLTTLIAVPATPPAPAPGVPAVDFSSLLVAALEAVRPEAASGAGPAAGGDCAAEGWGSERVMAAGEAPPEAPPGLAATLRSTRGAGFPTAEKLASAPEKDEKPAEPDDAALPLLAGGVTISGQTSPLPKTPAPGGDYRIAPAREDGVREESPAEGVEGGPGPVALPSALAWDAWPATTSPNGVTAGGPSAGVGVDNGETVATGSDARTVRANAALPSEPCSLPEEAFSPGHVEPQMTNQQDPEPAAAVPQREAEPAEGLEPPGAALRATAGTELWETRPTPDRGIRAAESPATRGFRTAEEPVPGRAEMAFAIRIMPQPSREAPGGSNSEAAPIPRTSPSPVDAPPPRPVPAPDRRESTFSIPSEHRTMLGWAEPTDVPARPAADVRPAPERNPAGGEIVDTVRPDGGAEVWVRPPEAASAGGEAHRARRSIPVTPGDAELGVRRDGVEGAAQPAGPANRASYGAMGTPAGEVGGAERGQPAPGGRGRAGSAESMAAARVLSTQPEVSVSAHGLPRPSAPREIALRVSEAGRPPVDVRLQDRGGELRVAVHTRDSELAASMRSELPELVSSLERRGFQAETWRSPAAELPGPAAVQDSRGRGFDLPGGNSRDGQAGGEFRDSPEQRQQHRRQNARPESGFVFASNSTEEEPSK